MTKVTDRISDSAMVEFAKKQYESKQKSKVPTQIVYLTSKGLVYPESHPLRKGYVNMRYMTAYDEDIITNDLYIKEGIMFDVLLAELITDDIDINDIALIDKDALIVNARILGYGAEYPISVNDPSTNKLLERTIDLNKLLPVDFKLTPDANGEFDFNLNDTTLIKFKFKTEYDSEKADPTRLVSSFLFSIIKEVNGDRSIDRITNFIKYELSPLDSRKLRKYYNENSVSLITNIDIEDELGSIFQTNFQIGADLFWI